MDKKVILFKNIYILDWTILRKKSYTFSLIFLDEFFFILSNITLCFLQKKSLLLFNRFLHGSLALISKITTLASFLVRNSQGQLGFSLTLNVSAHDIRGCYLWILPWTSHRCHTQWSNTVILKFRVIIFSAILFFVFSSTFGICNEDKKFQLLVHIINVQAWC